jgi:hypothetical protein
MIGAYFQVFKQPYATYKTLEAFRYIYPDAPILLVSDNGYDYTNMAKHFNCKYIHYTSSCPVWVNHMGDDKLYKQKILEVYQRFLESIRQLECKYFIFLEDDVLIHRPLKNITDDDLQGACINKINPKVLEMLKLNYSDINPINNYFSGHGGSLYKRETIMRIFEDKELVNTVIDLSLQYRGNIFCINMCFDFFVSIMIYCLGGTIVPLEGHIDCHYWNNNCIIQHQFKVYYNKDMPEDIRWMVNTSIPHKV